MSFPEWLEQENQEWLSEEVNNELNRLKNEVWVNNWVSPETNQTEEIIGSIISFANELWISKDIINEYVSLIKQYSDNLQTDESYYLNEKTKEKLWSENIESKITKHMWFFLFCIKKYCPNNFREVIPLAYNMTSEARDEAWPKVLLWYFEKYWDSVYDYLQFCSPFEWSYLKKWVSLMHWLRHFWESRDEAENYENKSSWLDIEAKQLVLGYSSMYIQFLENFVNEPQSINLFKFLAKRPQKLDNLWWKEIKSIDLSTETWINFAFRGIIEMVKSRSDIEFPHINENTSESEVKEWEQKWEKIIKEYENMIRNYIAKDKIEDSNAKWKTFDKIFFTASKRVTPTSNDSEGMPSKEWVQQFSWNEVLDYSWAFHYWDELKELDDYFGKKQSWEIEPIKEKDERIKEIFVKGLKMVSDVEKYANEHPNERILVCINEHWRPDWSSGNLWTKEDWNRLANISPNVKIWSVRCYFWAAYDNNTIYNHKSSLSWFSDTTTTDYTVTEIVSNSWKKNLWFHEMEIYTRLNYPVSVTPLTESMEYTNRNTWETEIWKVWLAQNNGWWDYDPYNSYV